jgi:ketosteroid isomerase-like protein
MSVPNEEIIELLRRSYEAFNRGDFDAAVEVVHPDVVFVRTGDQSDLRGVDAFRGWMEPEAFESLHIEPVEFEVAGDKVLIRQRSTARGAGSGIEMRIDNWAVWTLDADLRITRIETYLDHEEDEARRALRAP